jgi:hypothetical protein
MKRLAVFERKILRVIYGPIKDNGEWRIRYNSELYALYKDVDIITFIKVGRLNGMARPQVADGGEGLQIWRVAANILNKQSGTADKGWPSSLGVGRGANNSPP